VIHKLVADYWLLSKEAAHKVESILKSKGLYAEPIGELIEVRIASIY
jgi:selenide,water dikinase